MKFRNYCLVFLGETNGVKNEIIKVSETEPNLLEAKGIIIATITSSIEPSEMTEWFKSNNRNFLLFDLNKENSGFNITKKIIHDGLFSFIERTDLNEMSSSFIKEIITSSNKLDEKKINKMTKEEKQEMLNILIDNGLEKLSDEDKKLLHLLAK